MLKSKMERQRLWNVLQVEEHILLFFIYKKVAKRQYVLIFCFVGMWHYDMVRWREHGVHQLMFGKNKYWRDTDIAILQFLILSLLYSLHAYLSTWSEENLQNIQSFSCINWRKILFSKLIYVMLFAITNISILKCQILVFLVITNNSVLRSVKF